MSGNQESNIGQQPAQIANQGSGTKKRKSYPTQERVRELFDYDPNTGELTWAIDVRGGQGAIRVKRGTTVGAFNSTNGYLQTQVDKKFIYLHRIIWIWMEGYAPEHQIDHINRVRTDNRWCNLREINQSCNNINCKIRSDNVSGVKGVGKFRINQWRVRVHLGVKEIHIGVYDDFTEAVAHRLAMEQCSSLRIYDEGSTAYQYMQNYLQELKCQES